MHCSHSLVLGLFISVSRPFGLGERVGMVVIEPPLCAECSAWYSRLMIHFIQATSGKNVGSIISILQVEKLRLRKIKQFSQAQTVNDSVEI